MGGFLSMPKSSKRKKSTKIVKRSASKSRKGTKKVYKSPNKKRKAYK